MAKPGLGWEEPDILCAPFHIRELTERCHLDLEGGSKCRIQQLWRSLDIAGCNFIPHRLSKNFRILC